MALVSITERRLSLAHSRLWVVVSINWSCLRAFLVCWSTGLLFPLHARRGLAALRELVAPSHSAELQVYQRSHPPAAKKPTKKWLSCFSGGSAGLQPCEKAGKHKGFSPGLLFPWQPPPNPHCPIGSIITSTSRCRVVPGISNDPSTIGLPAIRNDVPSTEVDRTTGSCGPTPDLSSATLDRSTFERNDAPPP